MEKSLDGISSIILYVCTILVVIVANIGSTNEIIDAIPKQNQINYDYEIDLKPNYIIVYSQGGNVDTIPHGTLEDFFERDNL